MKKLITAALIVAGAGAAAGGYLHYRAPAGRDLAAVVPADTLLYVEAAGGRQWWEDMRRAGGAVPPDELARTREKLDAYGPAGRMTYGLYAAYAQRIAEGKPAIPGLGESPRGAAYTIGLAPVMRLALEDPDAFRAFIDDAEKRGGVQALAGRYRDVGFRSYPLAVDGQSTPAALIVAVRGKLAVLTIDLPDFRDQVLPLALGLKTPGMSLADTGMLGRIAETHGLQKAGISFISHRAVIDALTGGDDRLAARMLTLLAGDRAAELEPWRTAACRKDLAAAADLSPLTVFGWTDGDSRNVKAVTEINDAALLQSLRRLRGHLPAFLREPDTRPVLSLAVGMNMSTPASVATDLWQRFTGAPFQCEWLVDAQRRAREQNPAAVAMGALMLSSVRGASLSLYGATQTKGADAPLEGTDALLTVSTEDPQPLIALARGFLPALAKVEIPSDGSLVVLPVSLGTKYPLMASATKTHIAVFLGPHAGKAVATLKNEDLSANGLFYLAVDYRELAPMLLDPANVGSAAAAQGASPQTVEEVGKSIREMADMNLPVWETLDISDQGIVLEARMARARPE